MNYDEIINENNKINKIQDSAFINNFRKEWEEVTSKLRSISEADKLVGDKPKNNEVYRPTSSSIVFK